MQASADKTAPDRESGEEAVEIIVIDRPFLTRPHLFLSGREQQAERPRIPLHEQLELLREALRPFAELGDLFRSAEGDRPVFSMKFGHGRWRDLTIKDFRRARAVLDRTKP